jgi:cytoskeleton protein RodZ
MALLKRLKVPFAEEPPKGNAILPSGARSAGDLMRQQREALGLDLADIAAALRIKPAYLVALEAGRPDQLPGPAYAIGFMRAYADHLGLDGGEVLRRFKQESTALARKPDLSFPMPLGERGIPGGGILLVAMILAICGYGTWYYLSTAELSRPQRVAEVPAELLPRKAEPAAAVPYSTEALAAPRAAAPSGDSPTLSNATSATPASAGAPADRAIPPALPPSAASAAAPGLVPDASHDFAQTAALAPPLSPQGISGPASPSTRMVIHATADSWVQIRDAGQGQAILLARVLKAGESYGVPDRSGLSMRTGNAGGLQITVDGSQTPSIGRIGAVRRNVALDPQSLIAGTAVRD